jgi:dephospho-CoA kinase
LIIDLAALINVAVFAAIVGAAVIYMASMARKQNHNAVKDLANTRGDKIEDQEGEIAELRERIIRLEGQVELVLSRKFDDLANDIAAKVADKLPEVLDSIG